MTTIKDIADRLGISISSVSKGLSGASDIREETRQAVLDTAVELGYIPRRNKAESHAKKICIFAQNMGYENIEEFGYEIIIGFRLFAAKNAWQVEIVPLSTQDMQTLVYDEYMISHQYDAGFMLGFSLRDEFLSRMQDTIIPTVLLDNVMCNPAVACVGIDNQQGMSCAIHELASKGHKKIAFMNGNKDSRVAVERLQGYEMAMRSHGLVVSDLLIAHGDFLASPPTSVIQGFIENGATAIACAGDIIASKTISEVIQLGRRVPEDISIIGFDDLPLAKYTSPPLTTIRQDRLAIGKSVCVALEQVMSGNPINRLLLTPELILRSSTAVSADSESKPSIPLSL